MTKTEYFIDFIYKTEPDACEQYPGMMSIASKISECEDVLVSAITPEIFLGDISRHISVKGSGTGGITIWRLKQTFWKSEEFLKYLFTEYAIREKKISELEDKFSALQSELLEIDNLIYKTV